MKSDKALHFVVCAGVTLAVGLVIAWWCGVWAWWYGAAVALALGVAKEVNDARWDWGDFGADVLGIAVGLTPWGIVWMVGKLVN